VNYLNNLLRVGSRFLNTLIGGYPTETLSGRCWYEKRIFWVWFLDSIWGKNHCYDTWLVDFYHKDKRKESDGN
jgi:hypothetical protein